MEATSRLVPDGAPMDVLHVGVGLDEKDYRSKVRVLAHGRRRTLP